MSHKPLHELLREDQEPFHLNDYIADRRCQLKSTTTTTTAATALKRKPIIEPTISRTTRSFCINYACLFTSQHSPDVRPSSATKSHNASVLLRIPARTSAMLLDAATRVQKQSSSNVGFGLLGSFLRRLKHKTARSNRHEISSGDGEAREKEIVAVLNVNGNAYDHRSRRSCNISMPSSADWSEKSSESETSCSSISVHESYEIETENHVLSSSDKCFCTCPSSPFRFSVHQTPPPDYRSQGFLSPETSPSCRLRQTNDNYDAQYPLEISVEDDEQCSPVSVLDPPFVDDQHQDDEHNSYASVQRTRPLLVQKLGRFKSLVELDPTTLEMHMVEQDDENLLRECEEEEEEEEEETMHKGFLEVIQNHLGVKKIPSHMKRLVMDIIAEEEKNETVAKRVCMRLDLWKMVESITIDMMVEYEFRIEKSEGWKKYDGKGIIRKIAMNIEELLVEELLQELVTSFGH